jgi:sugar phosphate isomerase/epimerase
MDRASEGFATLCGLAAERDLRVCIEFFRSAAIANLATAWRIVSEAGAPNGGILVDMMHWQRQPGGPDLALLERLPGERIHVVQVCDTTAEPIAGGDYMTEALSARVLPGEGVVDARALFDVLSKIGADPFFAFEVFSADLAAAGPEAMARTVRQTAASLFD